MIRRSERLFQRDSQDSLWQLLAEQFYPERATFTATYEQGHEFASHLFEGSPVMLRRDLGNAFSAMLRPRGQQWMKAGVADAEDLQDPHAAEIFFQHVTRRVRAVLYDRRSKFVRATKEADHDYATFGAAAIQVEAADDRKAIRYRCHHLSNCAWAENHQGDIDTFHLKGMMTARQMEQKFRWRGDVLHKNVTKCLDYSKGNPDKEFEVRHICMPVGEYEYEGRKPPRGMKYTSIYLDMTNKHIIRQKGSYEFRYVVPRWQTISGTAYPVSPASMVALPDARMIQRMALVMLEAAEKQIDPPMVATQDAVIGDINLGASGITWIDKEYDERFGDALRPIDLAKNVRLGVDMLTRTHEQLAEAWFVNKLNLPERGERTAYEMARRVEEYIRAAVPLFEPLETEYNAPLLEVTAAIMLRLGGFDLGIAPKELAKEEILWSFANPLQDALEQQKIFAAQTNLELLAGHAQFDQSVLKNYDFGSSLRSAVLATGCPASWLHPEEEAREAIEQAEQERRMTQAVHEAGMAGAAAHNVGAGAEALGVAPGAALEELMQ